ncbi:MAG: class E sortase [Bifidobacteriaceae bacterium]|jgi:sortase A|nr:class E sortase [Bifidobacteriaceae bacterium]
MTTSRDDPNAGELTLRPSWRPVDRPPAPVGAQQPPSVSPPPAVGSPASAPLVGAPPGSPVARTETGPARAQGGPAASGGQTASDGQTAPTPKPTSKPTSAPAPTLAPTPKAAPAASGGERRQRSERRRKRHGAAIVGGIGELLITVGLLLGLYVVWELVWTDVEANAVAKEVLKEVVAAPEWIEPAPVEGSEFAPRHDPDTDEPPTEPVDVPGFGEVWATMHVPRWGLEYNVPIVEGIDRVKILNKGLIGHYEGTQRPGEVGNFATSAHRTTYGKPYNRVAELIDGDSLIVETERYYYVYKVYGREIVYPRDVRVIWPVPNEADAVPTKRIITLTTCHPMFSAAQRYVIWGELEYWADKTEGPLEELVAEG